MWLIIIIAVIASIYMRFTDIEADPPMYFDGQSQSLSTDPHHYSYFARNKILFDQWELFDTERWRVFEATLISGISYILFSIFGISRTVANIPGPLMIILSLFFFAMALRRYIKLEALAVIVILLLFNKVLFVYGQLPYTENGMLFLMALLFYIFVEHRHRLAGIITVGVLTALAALAGKIFGIIIIVPVIVTLWLESGPDKIKRIITIIIAAAITSAIWIMLFYGGSLGAFFDYYRSQTVGLYGVPDAFKSPLTFIEKLINFGNDSRFYFHAPVLGATGFFALAAALVRISKNKISQNIPLLFLVIWFAAGVLFFMPENYRPLRYIYMLYLPLAGIVGFMLSPAETNKENAQPAKKIWKYALLLLLFWILIEQLIFNILHIGQYTTEARPDVWISLPIAILLTFLDYRFAFMRLFRRPLILKIFASAVVILALVNYALPYTEWQQQKSYNLKEAGEDIGQILGRDAVVCGPIVPSILLENSLQGNIYAVGVTDQDPLFFAKNRITHFVIDAMASGMILDKYEELLSASQIAEYWIRDAKILVVNISHLTGNKQAAAYKMTDYETARAYMHQKAFESALMYMERFIAKYPNNKSALLALGDIYPLNGRPDDAMAALLKAESLYPRDFSVKMALAIYYQKRFMASNDDKYRRLARQTYEKVIELNPYQADEVTEITRRIADLR